MPSLQKKLWKRFVTNKARISTVDLRLPATCREHSEMVLSNLGFSGLGDPSDPFRSVAGLWTFQPPFGVAGLERLFFTPFRWPSPWLRRWLRPKRQVGRRRRRGGLDAASESVKPQNSLGTTEQIEQVPHDSSFLGISTHQQGLQVSTHGLFGSIRERR